MSPPPRTVLSVAIGVGAAGAVLAGGALGIVAVLVVSVLLLADLQVLMVRAGTPPMLPAAAIVAVGGPLLADGLAPLMTLTAVALAAAALMLLATGRRAGATAVLGATLLAGLLPGLGGAAVIAFREEGAAAVAVLLALLAVGHLAQAGVRSWRPGQENAELVGVLGAVGVGTGLAALTPAVSSSVAAVLGALSILGLLGGASLREALPRPPRGPVGAVMDATAPTMLVAPPAILLVQALTALG